MSAITAALGSFVSNLRPEHVPAEVRGIVCRGFIDTVGVMMAGAGEPAVARLLSDSDGIERGNSGARVLLSSRRLTSPEAALIGATAAHALDYDDVALSGHPSAVLVPALLAEGDTVGSSGAELITAYVAGFEVWADLFRRGKNYHRKGWHPTSIFGPIATAAATSRLRKLPAQETAHALAIAASHACGLVANFGTMTKPLHAGLAAQNGIRAAQLAGRGFTGALDALEHPQGFLMAVSPDGKADLSSEVSAGEPWALLRSGLNVKRYPTCYATHRTIDAMIDLAREHDLQAGDVELVEARMGRGQAAALRNANPGTALEAKFSEEFAMACAIVHRQIGLSQLSDGTVGDPVLRGLFARVKTVLLDEQDAEDPVFSPTEDLVVRLKDGTTLERLGIRHPRGHARNPMSDDELRAKYTDCVSVPGLRNADTIYAALRDLEALRSTSEIPVTESGSA